MIPEEMQNLITDLKDAPSKDVALRAAYDVLVKEFRAPRLAWLHWRAFEDHPMRLWHRKTLTAVQLNAILRTVLIESGHFSADDIRTHWTLVWLCPHQYLTVRVDDTVVTVDVWGAHRRVHYDSKARGFV